MGRTGKGGAMIVTIHIERLILSGPCITYDQQQLLQATIETELSRLVEEGGLGARLTAGDDVYHLSAGAFELVDRRDPIELGRQIANTVYKGLER